MKEARKQEIAYLYLKHRLRQEGVRLKPSLRQQVGKAAKAIDIPREEAVEFAKIMVRDLFEETFVKPSNRGD